MFLKRMLRGYKLDDPETKHQKCLPIIVFKTMWANNKTVMSLVIGQLACGALFFGMRSCEYSKVEGTRKTKIIRICDLTFRFGKRVIPIRRGSLHLLKHASSISVTFRSQKSDENFQTVTMFDTVESDLSPTKAWAAVVVRILSYPGTDMTSQVNIVRIGKNNCYVTAKQIAVHLRTTVNFIGKAKLGFTGDEVGTHSVRSSFAMLLYLAKVRTPTLMLLGRWASDAVLLYIRKQVLEFSEGITEEMLKNDFYTVPDMERCLEDDPRTRKSNPSTSLSQVGCNKGQREIAKRPNFNVWSSSY